MQIADFLKTRVVQLQDWRESEQLEWKESTADLRAIVNTIAAFANTSGGVLVCGVNDDGVVTGQTVEDSSLRSITQAILANTDERLIANVERATLEGRSVLVVQVNESPLKPHLSYGKAYKRMGPSNVALSQAEYRSMLTLKQNGYGADRDLLPDLSIADIHTDSLYKFVEVANIKRDSNFSSLADPQDILTNLELMHNGIITKGAVLLFGQNPQKVVPAAEVRAALFESPERAVFLDQEIISGTLFHQFDKTIEFVKKHLQLGTNTAFIGNRSTAEYPLAAVQEMIANALVHRDYHDQASTYCNIVKSHSVEVNNPGALPAPRITPEIMPTTHPSIPRNRRIARVFYLAGIIEQWGLGGARMANACKAAGIADPVWSSENGTVSVRIEAAAVFNNE